MRNYEFIKDQFIKKHKNIDDEKYLDKYISTLINYELKEVMNYSEKHHILPRSTFPEYENEDWNIIELDYEDHKLSHLWIFKAINIRKYQRPLNWMMTYYKNSEEISNASKRGWVKLKANKEKYNKWRKGKSDMMKDLSIKEQRRRANIFWKNISDTDYKKFCKDMSDYWTSDKRIEKSKQMKEFYSDISNRNKKSIESKKIWDNRSKKSRINFKNKMSTINKDESKRIDAGLKIKEKWLDSDYLSKMKKRAKNPGTKLKIINNIGENLIIDNMTNIAKKYNFSAHLMRKYRDSGNKISKQHLNDNNLILIDCIIETLK